MARVDSSPDEVIKEGLDAIRISRDDDLCKILGIKDQDMQLPNSVAKQVYESVKKLFAQQYAHAQDCGAIINRLFRVQRDQSSGYFQISLSPTLIQGGFPELNSINYDARELLMKYYYNCETTYLHGVQDIIDAKRAADASKAQAQQQQQQQQAQAQQQQQAQGAQAQVQAQQAQAQTQVQTQVQRQGQQSRVPILHPSPQQQRSNQLRAQQQIIYNSRFPGRRKSLRLNPIPEGAEGGRRHTMKRRHYIGKE
jgi:hypothetical protein